MRPRYNKRRRYRKRRYPYRSKYSKILRTVNPGPRVEIKSVDLDEIELNGNFDRTTPLIGLLNAVQTGAGYFNRIGNRIAMKSVHLTGLIYSTQSNTATLGEDINRIAIVYDRQANGAAPLYSDIFNAQKQNGNPVGTFRALTPINMVNKERFLILRDERLFMPSVGVSGNAPLKVQLGTNGNSGVRHTYFINFFIKMKGLETIYKSSTNPTAIGDIASGSLWIVLCPENAISISNNVSWAFQGQCRTKFLDA